MCILYNWVQLNIFVIRCEEIKNEICLHSVCVQCVVFKNMDAELDMYLFLSMLPFSDVYYFMNVSLYFFCPCYYCTMCDPF